VTVDGTVATEVLLLKRLISTPPVPAGPLSVTVPCEEPDDLTVLGARLSDDKIGVAGTGGGGSTLTGWTVKLADTIAPEYAALSWTLAGAVTDPVFTVNDAAVVPALIVTLAGTLATPELPLVNETAAPPLGAAAVRVTVPLEVLPPVTDVGLSENEDKVAGAVAGALPVCTL